MGCASSVEVDITDQLHPITAQQANIEPHHFVLEIGFKNGHGLQEVLKMIKGGSGRLIGTETSSILLNKVTNLLQADIATGVLELDLCSPETLTYIPNMFDRVFTVNGFYYWDNIDSVVAEIYRVTRPGCLFLTCVYKSTKMNKTNLSDIKNDDYTIEKYADTLKEHGFVKIKVQEHRNAISGSKYQTIHAYTRSRK